MPRPKEARELLLEGLDVWSLHKLPAFTAVLDDLLQFRNDPGAKPCDSGHCYFLTQLALERSIARRSYEPSTFNDPSTASPMTSAPFQPPNPYCAR